jgi:lipoprotein-anchoring transpeptidase ErfK/SrfK
LRGFRPKINVIRLKLYTPAPSLGGNTVIFRWFRALVLVVVAAGVIVAAGNADLAPIAFQAPSPAAGSVLTVEAGKKMSFTVAAATATPGALIKLKTSKLPRGASFRITKGNPATGVFSWRPTGPQIGDRSLTLGAQAAGLPVASLPLTLHVVPGYAQLTTSSADFSHWAYVGLPTVVRAAPSRHASAIGHVGLWTPENYPNLVTLLEQKTLKDGTWVHVRFPKLPNNTTGWIKRGALGSYHALSTHVVVNRAATTLTLYKAGKVIFKTRVGVGQSRWPTPGGEFYITEKLTGFHNAAYGPLAFGTSARSSVLTDWPGGGFIGIHGTDAPGLIPGHISHGCIRLRNAAILRLARMLPVGTPLSIQ